MDSDFDEELLALADGASSRPKNAQKSKKKKAPGEKKRKRAAKEYVQSIYVALKEAKKRACLTGFWIVK